MFIPLMMRWVWMVSGANSAIIMVWIGLQTCKWQLAGTIATQPHCSLRRLHSLLVTTSPFRVWHWISRQIINSSSDLSLTNVFWFLRLVVHFNGLILISQLKAATCLRIWDSVEGNYVNTPFVCELEKISTTSVEGLRTNCFKGFLESRGHRPDTQVCNWIYTSS